MYQWKLEGNGQTRINKIWRVIPADMNQRNIEDCVQTFITECGGSHEDTNQRIEGGYMQKCIN